MPGSSLSVHMSGADKSLFLNVKQISTKRGIRSRDYLSGCVTSQTGSRNSSNSEQTVVSTRGW